METLVIVAGFVVVGMIISPIFLLRGQFGKPKAPPVPDGKEGAGE